MHSDSSFSSQGAAGSPDRGLARPGRTQQVLPAVLLWCHTAPWVFPYLGSVYILFCGFFLPFELQGPRSHQWGDASGVLRAEGPELRVPTG